MEVTCLLCGNKIKSEDLEQHLLKHHFMSFKTYYEIFKTSIPDLKCWKCGEQRILLTPYSNNFLLPCLNCLPPNKDKEAQETTLLEITNYLNLLEKSTSLQYFLSDQDLSSQVFPHTIEIFDEIIKTLKKGRGRVPNNSFIELELKNNWSLQEISTRNVNNLRLNIYDGVLESIILGGNHYEISPPETCVYDSRHHTKYSILNPASTKEIRKLKLSDKTCYKFTDLTIFKVLDSNGQVVNPLTEFSEYDLIILKNYILRNPKLFKILRNIYYDICRFCNILSDNVFIKNTIPLSRNQNVEIFNFSWFKNNVDWSTKSIINLSIL